MDWTLKSPRTGSIQLYIWEEDDRVHKSRCTTSSQEPCRAGHMKLVDTLKWRIGLSFKGKRITLRFTIILSWNIIFKEDNIKGIKIHFLKYNRLYSFSLDVEKNGNRRGKWHKTFTGLGKVVYQFWKLFSGWENLRYAFIKVTLNTA